MAWPNGYTYRRTLSIVQAKVPSVQTSFPMLFSGTYTYLKTTANSGNVTNASGYDVIFTSDAAGSTKLAWEIESYSATTGAVRYWVKISSTDGVVYLFYGNSGISTDQSNKTGTWDANYVGVYHFGDGTTLSLEDSTSNANNGTANSGVTAGASQSQMPVGCGSFGSNQRITTPITTALGNFTAQAWYKSNTNAAFQRIFEKNYATGFWMGQSGGTGAAADKWGGGIRQTADPYGTYVTAAVNAWHWMTKKRSGTTTYTDVDGGAAKANAVVDATALDTSTLYIGGVGGESFIGQIDEVRISNIARADNWITAEYNSMFDPSTFYTLGSEETSTDVPRRPVIINLAVTRAASW